MGAERLLVMSKELKAERRRVDEILTALIDSVLERRNRVVGQGDAKYLLGTFATDLTHLAEVIRQGGTAADLEQRLARHLAAG